MKKSCIRVIAIAVMAFLFSISGNAQLKFGVKGGLNLSSMSGMVEMIKAANELGLEIPGSYRVSYTPAFHLGFMAQCNLPANFFLQPELLFSMQGLKEEMSGYGTEISRLNFLKLPVYAGYKVNAGLGLDIILGVGPYAAYGFYGSEGAYGKDGIFQHFDAGLSAMGGIQFNKLQVTVGYD